MRIATYRVLVVFGMTRKWIQSTEDKDSGYPTPMNDTMSPVGIIVTRITLAGSYIDLMNL